jgi:hypothetical protein
MFKGRLAAFSPFPTPINTPEMFHVKLFGPIEGPKSYKGKDIAAAIDLVRSREFVVRCGAGGRGAPMAKSMPGKIVLL